MNIGRAAEVEVEVEVDVTMAQANSEASTSASWLVLNLMNQLYICSPAKLKVLYLLSQALSFYHCDCYIQMA